MSMDIDTQRRLIQPLLAPADPEDAMTAYYALQHDARRTQLTLHFGPAGQIDGFVAVCQTGRDLFVPLVVMRAPVGAVHDLLRQAMLPNRPYRVVTKVALRPDIHKAMLISEPRVNNLLALDPVVFRPVMNVMVQPGEVPFRFEIRSQGQVAAAAGVNWQSARWAEIYIYTVPEFQKRGWGRAVGEACVLALLQARLLPLYVSAEDNRASWKLADGLGFRARGIHEFEGQGQLRWE